MLLIEGGLRGGGWFGRNEKSFSVYISFIAFCPFLFPSGFLARGHVCFNVYESRFLLYVRVSFRVCFVPFHARSKILHVYRLDTARANADNNKSTQ
jgi:hypothetical protein